MMRKFSVVVLAALMSVTMLACGSQTSSSTQTTSSTKTESTASQKTASEEDKLVDMLSFINDGEVYFDVNVTDALKDLKITVGGKDALAEKKVAFSSDTDYSIESTAEPGKKVSIYIVTANKEDGHYRYQQLISQGFDSEMAPERLSKLLSQYLKGGSTKLYFAVTEDPKGWDHSLNEKLNEFLDGYIK